MERSIYTNFLNKTIKDCIERKLPDRLYNSLSKKDISTLSNLKESAMILGHWDSDPFDNYKPKRYDNRRNSGNNLSHQNHYYQKYNSQTHNYPRNSYNNNMNNSTNPQSSTNRNQINQIPPRNQGNYQEFRRNLDQGRAQNPLNFQASTSNNSPNAPVKRQRENESTQNRMDVNFQQTASDSEDVAHM